MNELFEQAKVFLKSKIMGSTTFDEIEKQYRYDHTMRVTKIGLEIAKQEGLDRLIVGLGCILHDCAKLEEVANIDHGRLSANVARPFLETLDLTTKQVDDICYAIAIHVDGVAGYEYPNFLEAEVVSDADNIDRFGIYRIYQELSWKKIETLSIQDQIAYVQKRISGLNRLLKEHKLATPTSNRLFSNNLNAQISFFEALLKELNTTLEV